MKRNSAHNELEIRVLIEEAFGRGDEEIFHETTWYKHDSDEIICKSKIEVVGYRLDFKSYEIYKEL